MAALTCSSKNMSLLSIESIAEMLCLLKLIPPGKKNQPCDAVYSNSHSYIKFDLDFKVKTFMTSGSNEGDGCDVQGVYSWCSQNASQLIIPDLIKSFLTPAANASQERCVALNTSSTKDNSSALNLISCASEQFPYICEPLCISATCPTATNCAKNVILFM
jgi:hypothetical protein